MQWSKGYLLAIYESHSDCASNMAVNFTNTFPHTCTHVRKGITDHQVGCARAYRTRSHFVTVHIVDEIGLLRSARPEILFHFWFDRGKWLGGSSPSLIEIYGAFANWWNASGPSIQALDTTLISSSMDVFIKEIYKIFSKYIKCVFSYLTWIVDPTINIISVAHHSCEMSEYAFYVLWKYSFIRWERDA